MLPHTSILDALIRLKLMEPSERPSFTELHGGISSEIYKIDLKLGPVCAKRALPTLKSDPDWHVPVERSAAEWEWLRMAQEIVPGLAPNPLGYDQEANILVMTYLEPERYPNWKDLLKRGLIDPSFAAAAADKLVQLQNATAGMKEAEQRFNNDKTFHAIRLEAYFLATGRAIPASNGSDLIGCPLKPMHPIKSLKSCTYKLDIGHNEAHFSIKWRCLSTPSRQMKLLHTNIDTHIIFVSTPIWIAG